MPLCLSQCLCLPWVKNSRQHRSPRSLRCWSRLAAFLIVLITCAAGVAAQEVLTNETVVNMSKAHLGDKLIVEMIEKNPGNYVASSRALIALKQQGVSDTVIAAVKAKAVIERETVPSPVGEETPQYKAASPWAIHDKKDQISGESDFEAIMNQSAESNGRSGVFQVTAGCDPYGVTLKILYTSRTNKNAAYKMSPGNWMMNSPHVVMRLSIDGQTGSAPSMTSDFNNEATLWFQRELSEQEKTANPIGVGILGSLSGMMSPATPAQVFAGRLIKIEMPLNNGDLPIVEIHPQDAVFRKFAARCVSRFNVRPAGKDQPRPTLY